MENKINKLATITEQYKELAEQIEALKCEIHYELQANKSMRSEPTDKGYYAMRVKTNKQSVDQNAALEYIRNRPDIEADLFLNVNNAMYKELAEQEIKKTGEVLPGIETYETEYITIRKVKK